jgi:cytochrome c oxidase assembly protein subunit 15
VLGITTLLHQAPLALALLHQAMALVVLAIAVVHAERLERRPAPAAEVTGSAAMRRREQAT